MDDWVRINSLVLSPEERAHSAMGMRSPVQEDLCWPGRTPHSMV
jgi:hypothetical protein